MHFDPSFGTGRPGAPTGACRRHVGQLIEAAFTLQERVGDPFLSLVVEPVKGAIRV